MKVIYIENSIQDENTENPELMDGVLYHWKTQPLKLRGTFKEHIHLFSLRHPDVKYFLISDIHSTHKYFCDQGCKPGEGCKKYYTEDDHAIIIYYYTIK